MCKIFLAAISAAFFFGCNDSSNSASAEESPASSAAETLPASSGTETGVSSTGEEMLLSSSGTEIGTSSASAPAAPLAVTPDADGFYAIEDIYKAAPATSKIAFVIRHAEREADLGQLSNLTENGVAAAQALGAKLAGGDESFYYASTDFVRTRETANNIAIGRGEETFETVTWSGIDGSYFLAVSSDSLDKFSKSRGGTWKIISRWAYADEKMSESLANLINGHFYDLFARGEQFVKEVIVANMPTWKRVSVLVSHDVLVSPLIVYASNRTVDLRFYQDSHWVNYLSGVAIVVDEAGAFALYPVRGMDVGYMIVSPNEAN